MFKDPILFQYYKGLLFGIGIGVSLGWLWWRLPVVARTRRVRKLRNIVLDMRRIEAAFTGRRIENTRELRVHRVPLRDRIAESWAAWVQSTTPRTPEQVAREAQQRILAEVV